MAIYIKGLLRYIIRLGIVLICILMGEEVNLFYRLLIFDNANGLYDSTDTCY